MIQLKNISKQFQGSPALRSINLSIEQSKTTVLIGPSGCGKSTLLKMIIGLVQPDTGQVFIEGEQVSEENVQAIRQRLGYVIQSGGLFPHLSARDNICLMANHLGWDKARREQRLEELAELTQLDSDWLNRFPAQLSGGQQQRVCMVRALMLDPEILLLDEPMGALDPMIRYDLQTELRSIFQKLGKTVVMVTHDMGEASFIADTIVLMRRGEIVQHGSVEELIQKPSTPFVSKFIQAQRNPLECVS